MAANPIPAAIISTTRIVTPVGRPIFHLFIQACQLRKDALKLTLCEHGVRVKHDTTMGRTGGKTQRESFQQGLKQRSRLARLRARKTIAD